MSRWQIDPAGVKATLTEVQGATTELGASFDSLPDIFDDLIAGCGPDLMSVVNEVAIQVGYDVGIAKTVGDRISGAVQGAGDATVAFLDGDEEMARTIARSAAKSQEGGSSTYIGELP
jgi:hypothetical protein